MKYSESLKKNRDFQQVYKRGTSKANRYLVMYVLPNQHMMNRLGISEGYIMKYHQSKQDLPEDEYLKNLKILEYDILYGKKEIYGGETPYEATDLKMGIDDIEIYEERAKTEQE